MTLEQARQKRDEIIARTDIGQAQKQAQLMRLQAQLRREHPEMDLADLGE
jgi:aryl carrier-like protein